MPGKISLNLFDDEASLFSFVKLKICIKVELFSPREHIILIDVSIELKYLF